jgi:hypothetical protein
MDVPSFLDIEQILADRLHGSAVQLNVGVENGK